MAGSFRIFVNYRQDDAALLAGIVRDELAGHFGDENVAMAIDFPLGIDFRDVIAEHVSSCDVFLVVIGTDWLKLLAKKQKSGEIDYVVEEIQAALERGIPVVPVPLAGALVPAEHLLPPEIGQLAYKNAAMLSSVHWKQDLASLVERLDSLAATLAGRAPRLVEAAAAGDNGGPPERPAPPPPPVQTVPPEPRRSIAKKGLNRLRSGGWLGVVS
ncbi:MAG TPA: hypothetical protein VLJ76_01975 [Gaiellaceae bacterium]|nr:hypothetical protein [Gaiellaceae bacterium]